MKPRYILITFALLIVAAFATACGGSSGGNANTGPEPTPATSLALKANNVKFDKKSLAAPAGAQITLALDNEDGGVQHNFALYEDKSARKAVYKGDLFSGKKTQTYTFTAPTAGSYYFRCDAHPDMNGTFYSK